MKSFYFLLYYIFFYLYIVFINALESVKDTNRCEVHICFRFESSGTEHVPFTRGLLLYIGNCLTYLPT